MPNFVNTPEPNRNKAFLHAFKVFGLLSYKNLSIIRDHYANDYEQAWNSNLSNILENSRENNQIQEKLSKFKQHFNIDESLHKLLQQNINIILPEEVDYPFLLKQTYDPPLCLYYRGSLSQNLVNIAVVGSRKMNHYGESAIKKIISGWNGLPVNIVSGLAFGADIYAHKQALENNIKTMAVLGGGIDDAGIYPSAHLNIAHKIIEAGGAIMSEFPPGSATYKSSFPLRNRIIAGISKATVIIQAKYKSGALITANVALQENRDVFALPGSIFDSLSQGPNHLIAKGATPLCSSNDLINYYGWAKQNNAQAKTGGDTSLSHDERKIINILEKGQMEFDELYTQTELAPNILIPLLTTLEIKNKIRVLENNSFALSLDNK